MSDIQTQKDLINEIYNLLDEPNKSLAPILRKAIRLAALCNKEEYKLLFDIHLDGIKIGEVGRIEKWKDKNKTPAWYPNDVFFDDRKVSDEKIVPFPIEELEFNLANIIEAKNKLFANNRYKEATQIVQQEKDLINVLIKIRNRITLFLREVESDIADRANFLKDVERIMESYAEKERRVLQKIYEMGNKSPEVWVIINDLAKALKMPFQELNPILNDLEDRKGLIGSVNEAVWIVPAGIESLQSQNTTERSPKITNNMQTQIDSRKVFVVYGRNLEIHNAMCSFLRSINLDPMEWSEARKLTGKPNPYVGEILDAGFSNAQAVLALFTPDDEAKLLEPFIKEDDEKHERELTPQPRQNVIFEAGMALAKFPDRTVLVQIGKIRPMSDISGLHIIRLNNSTETRQELAERLKDAGCDVKTEGKTRWHKEGNFELIIRSIVKDVNENITSEVEKLSEECVKVLNLLNELPDESEGAVTLYIAEKIQIPAPKTKYLLDLLVEKDMVTYFYDDDYGTLYSITKNGRKYLFESI